MLLRTLSKFVLNLVLLPLNVVANELYLFIIVSSKYSLHQKQQLHYDAFTLALHCLVRFWCFYVVVLFIFRLWCIFVGFDVTVSEHRKTQWPRVTQALWNNKTQVWKSLGRWKSRFYFLGVVFRELASV